MKFNFLGGQHKGFSPNQNTQETVNMFLGVDSSEENKLTLYRVDGKKDFIELPKSPIYNMAEFRGALYVVDTGDGPDTVANYTLKRRGKRGLFNPRSSTPLIPASSARYASP